MDKTVIKLVKIKFETTCPQIPFLVPVSLQDAIDACKEHKVTDIKFSSVIEEGSSDVGLDYIGFGLPILMFFLLDEGWNITELSQIDAIPSVGIFSWLDNPQLILILFVFPQKLLELWIFCVLHVVRFGNHFKRIHLQMFGVVVKQGAEKVFL